MIIGIILLIIAGVSEGVMDTLAHHFNTSIFNGLNPKFWNPTISGGNKWKNGLKENGEKFLFSSTLLVMFTEAWHVFKFIRTMTLFGGSFLFIYNSSIVFGLLIPIIVFKLSFSISYYFFGK